MIGDVGRGKGKWEEARNGAQISDILGWGGGGTEGSGGVG